MKSNRQLEKSYDLVGKKILQRNNLNLIDLKNSLNLFTKKNIKKQIMLLGKTKKFSC